LATPLNFKWVKTHRTPEERAALAPVREDGGKGPSQTGPGWVTISDLMREVQFVDRGSAK